MSDAEHHPVIMVVEDDKLIRDLLQTLFTDAGYSVIPADNGSTALAALTTMRPNLVTVDLNLPGVSGADVLAMIRKTPTLAGVKTVIISAEASIPKRVQSLADAVVAKPFQVDALLTLVSRLVPSPTGT